MREILFRGKAVGSLKWVEGFYFREAGNFIKELPGAVSTETHMVYEDTIGQYTGVTDKNGTKIFEGDIVKAYSATGELDSKKAVIYWDELFSQWKVNKSAVFGSDICATYEVIGNIHDNPELLKGGAE